jgi:hypothetical protein|tara:strand:- start:306 stop:455 length:150 start_codon:yes stop_codon:yes gene_type:complete
MAQRLTEIGIVTPLKLRQCDPEFIRERFNVVEDPVLDRKASSLRVRSAG